MPDVDLETTTQIIIDSVYGCAGQRCLAASVIIPVGDDKGLLKEALVDSAKKRKVGFGLEENVEMGPVITNNSKVRIENLIQEGVNEGSSLLVDGRDKTISGYEKGNFISPTILDGLPLNGKLLNTEIFGPVMNLIELKKLQTQIGSVKDTVNHFRPPIFWKDKQLVEKQVEIWSSKNVYELLNQVENLELNFSFLIINF